MSSDCLHRCSAMICHQFACRGDVDGRSSTFTASNDLTANVGFVNLGGTRNTGRVLIRTWRER
jgi:hypothetical protein